MVLDVPVALPEGTVLDLALADGGDDLDDEERRALEASLDQGLADVRAGRTRPADEILAKLRAKAG